MAEYTDPDSWQKKAVKPPVEGDIIHVESLYHGKYRITTVVERVIGYLPETGNWLVEAFLGITRRSRDREDSLAPNSQVIIKKAGNDWDLVRNA